MRKGKCTYHRRQISSVSKLSREARSDDIAVQRASRPARGGFRGKSSKNGLVLLS